MTRCIHPTRRGAQCRNTASDGDYCSVHSGLEGSALTPDDSEVLRTLSNLYHAENPRQSITERRRDARLALNRLKALGIPPERLPIAIELAFEGEFRTMLRGNYVRPELTPEANETTLQRVRAAVKRPKTPVWKKALGCVAWACLSLVEGALTGNISSYDKQGRRRNPIIFAI